MQEREFDAVVLGGGSTGEVCAGRLAAGGLAVALVEDHLVGGDCSYYACMPSKALLRPAQLVAEARRIPGAAQAVNGSLNVRAALARRDEVIHDLDDSGQLRWLEERGITLLRGFGRLAGERSVEVGDQSLRARRAVVIATGSTAALPPIDGLADVKPWRNYEATTAREVPESLLVLGGGPVGVELAQAWHSLGAEVVVVESAERLLPSEEPFAGAQLEAAFRQAGIDVRTKARAVSVAPADGELRLELDGGDVLHGDQLLVGVGRKPRSADIGLERVGLEPGGWLQVDDQLRVADKDWLYAAGDVNGRALLTHMGKYQARVAADHILGRDVAATADGKGPPRVTFTEPQIAAVGMTLQKAQELGLLVRAVDHPTAEIAGASFVGRTAAGTCRLVVDEDRRLLVGATFSGVETAELLHAATIAVIGEVPLERLWHAVPPFPTRSELWLRLLEAYGL